MNIVCIVPARGGSKRIPDKNIRNLCGKPLIFYTIEEALKSLLINKVFVTTESERIAEKVGEFNYNYKSNVGIINRPVEFATDLATTEETLIHAINELQEIKVNPDYVLLLPPTAPFRRVEHIDALIAKVIENNANSGQTISAVKIRTGKFEGGIFYEYDKDSCTIEMYKLEKKYIENSAAYLFKPEVLLTTGRMQDESNVGLLMQKPYDLDINDMIDWFFAEFLIEKGVV